MRITIIGGGPAGLYFALLMKRQNAVHDIRVVEQNPRDATYGFGVVFSEGALKFLARDDADFYTALTAAMEHWPEQTIVHRDQAIRIDGNGFSAIGRLELLHLLQNLCADAGVDTIYETPVDDFDTTAADLIVAADGVNSLVRTRLAQHFEPTVEELSNKFVWYGTEQLFDTLTLTFRETEHGAFVAHHYRYSPAMSTFIVECEAATWQRAGFAEMTEDENRVYCEQVFAPDLDGHALISNKSVWRNFPVVTNRHWTHDNIVLIGDALRTVHFSIGAGTRLALEDAIFLARAFEENDDVAGALARFEETRRPIVDKILAGAAGSFTWYQRFGEIMHRTPYPFAYSYMTRSGRMTHERLRETAPRFVGEYEADQGK